MKATKAIRVFGKVQGVWFRASTMNKANELGISGFVKNEPDGSVYIQATGAAELLNTFINWCHQGPSHARVEKVEVQELPLCNFAEFKIIR